MKMMKQPSKPISSPGRTEKFPPPLMRFLRNNAASRSRGRSRSTTMFFLRKKNIAIETTQEPSSPKVTCMGQVRVKRSSAKRVPSAAAGAPTKCHCCWWVPRALFFHRLIKPASCFCKPVWPNWGFLRRKNRDSKFTEASSPETELNFRGRCYPNYDESEQENRVTVTPTNDFVSNSSITTPPRNALLLTRCRSAPTRRRFGNEETEFENRGVCENKNRDPKMEAKLRFFKELEESLRDRIIMESEKTGEESQKCVHPLVLTRCKSEPARTAKKLVPEVKGSSNKTRTMLGFARVRFSHAL